jgi:hypothetical protein
MAFSACAKHGTGYKGGASTFFLRLVQGNETRGGKIQVCPNCAELLLDDLRQKFVKVSEGDDFYDFTEPFICANCGQGAAVHYQQFYGNAYPRGHTESQWYGRVCTACVDAVAEDFLLDKAQVRS